MFFGLKMLKNICRICANDTDVTKATNLFDKSASKLLQEINLLTGVVLEATKDLPEVICNNCQNDLHSAIEFRKRCLSNHKRWTQHLKGVSESKSSPTPSPTLVTRVRRSVRTRPRCPSENESVDNTTLSPDEVLIKVEHTNNDTEREDDFDHLDTESSSFTNDATENMSLLDDVDYVPMLTKPKRSRRLPQTTVKRQTRKQQLPVFFCDQCGRNVTGKSAFDRHLRKHSGIRPFQCEQCPARFLSAGELKGHQVSHTGVRNFPCRYCDRTYVNHSGRLRHERTHTNERPFVCVHCGKAFTNSYILKNHNLVHTGERLFRCDLCERSFSRPTHLKTHYRSNTHKQNVEKSYALEQRSTKKEELHSVSEIVMPQAANDPQAMIVVTVEVPSEQ